MKYLEIKQVTKNLTAIRKHKIGLAALWEERALARHWGLARHYARSQSLTRAEDPVKTKKAVQGFLLVGMLRLMGVEVPNIDEIFKKIRAEGFNVSDKRDQDSYFSDQFNKKFNAFHLAILDPNLEPLKADRFFFQQLKWLYNYPSPVIDVVKKELVFENKDKKVVFKFLDKKFDFIHKAGSQSTFGTGTNFSEGVVKEMIRGVLL